MLIHGLVVTFTSSIAVAQAPSVRLAGAFGVALASREPEPLQAAASSQAVEASVELPGGAMHRWQLGLRGETRAGGRPASEATVFGGPVLALQVAPGWLDLVPYVRGGLRVGIEQARRSTLAIGPHFGVGVERALWPGVVVGAEAVGFATLSAPLQATVGVAIALTVTDCVTD